MGGSISTASGVVFVGNSDDSRFRAIDGKTGKELWVIKLNGSVSALLAAHDVLVLAEGQAEAIVKHRDAQKAKVVF